MTTVKPSQDPQDKFRKLVYNLKTKYPTSFITDIRFNRLPGFLNVIVFTVSFLVERNDLQGFYDLDAEAGWAANCSELGILDFRRFKKYFKNEVQMYYEGRTIKITE